MAKVAIALALLVAGASAANLRASTGVGSCTVGTQIFPVDGRSGIIEDSPGTDDDYKNNHKCSWQINAGGPNEDPMTLDSTITLSFTQLDMEKRGASTGKCYDAVEVYSGCKADDNNANRKYELW